jgi:hypothetical protein
MTQDNIDFGAAGIQNSPEGARPFFIPPGVEWDALPEELQQAISALVNPAYEHFVLAADDGLERASGLTLVHLLWLEILDQIRLGQLLLDSNSTDSGSESRERAIAQHLKLVQAKLKASSFMLRLEEFEQKWGHAAGQTGV